MRHPATSETDLIGLRIPTGQFHSLEVPAYGKDKAVIIEFKAGKYERKKKEIFLLLGIMVLKILKRNLLR